MKMNTTMSGRLAVGLFLAAVFSVTAAAKSQLVAPSNPADRSAREAFQMLDGVGSRGILSSDRWSQLTAQLGLTNDKSSSTGADGGSWSMTAVDGSVVFETAVGADFVLYVINFSPSRSEIMPESLLTWMLTGASQVRFKKGDQIEITLPSESIAADGIRGSRSATVTVSADQGRFIRSYVTISWPRKPTAR